MAEHLPRIRDLSPPGEILLDALGERGMTGVELARRLQCSEKHVSQLIGGKVPLSTELALQLEQVLGIPAQLWNSLEFNFQSERRRRELRADYDRYIPWLRKFPIAAMVRCGYLPPDLPRDGAARAESLLQFFGVTSPEAWRDQWQDATARFRKAKGFDPDQAVLTAWLRCSELEAQRIACAPYDEDRFRRVLGEVRQLTTSPPSVFQPKMTALCASAGVALTFVPALPKLAMNGATRWLGAQKGAIHLSLRHRTDDQLWFSFFHEACHLLEHRTQTIYLDAAVVAAGDPWEERADAFARDQLIPPERLAAFLTAGDRSLTAIARFGDQLGIAPGIVVGRLQHDGHLRHNTGNRLKRTLRWAWEGRAN